MISKYAKVVAAIAAAALIAFAFAATYQHGYDVAEAKGNQALSAYKAKQASAAAAAASQAFGKYADNVLRGQHAEVLFLADQGKTTTQIGTLKEHIDAVAQPHISAPSHSASQPSVVTVNRCVFTRGFVRLWNAAAGIHDSADGALQASADSGGIAGLAGPDAAADSGVSQQDVLDWFTDYAARSRSTESKLKGVKAAVPDQEDSNRWMTSTTRATSKNSIARSRSQPQPGLRVVPASPRRSVRTRHAVSRSLMSVVARYRDVASASNARSGVSEC